MYKSLKNKDFILLLQGALFTAFGAVLYSSGINYWIFETTHSSSSVGLLSGIALFIRVFFSPIGGAIADQMRRRNVLVVTDFIRGFMFVIIAMMARQGFLNIYYVMFAVCVSGLCGSLFYPATNGLVPEILHETILVKGTAIIDGGTSALELVGSALSGILIIMLGVPNLILINGVCYLVSAISELFITNYKHNIDRKEITFVSVYKNLKNGFLTCKKLPGLLILIISMVLINLLTVGFYNLLVVYISQNGMTTEQYGYLSAVLSAGILIGTFLLSGLNIKLENQLKTAFICLICAELFLGFGIVIATFNITCICLLLGMVFNGMFNGLINAVIILMIPHEQRGVISGFLITSNLCGSMISSILFGFLGNLIRLNIIGFFGSFLACILGVILYYFSSSKYEKYFNSNHREA